jgi:hypothetical protein
MINTLILKQRAPTVYSDLIESQGEPSELVDREIAVIDMDAKTAFDTYLRYIGIIGFTDDIIEALDTLRAAEVKR